MPRPLSEQVVVITGASSGIGRETAIEMGKRGASLALAARNEQALNEVATEVEAAGGKAHTVVTDVADWAQVQQLAREAVSRFGRIDTWVNDASVALYATVKQTTADELTEVIQINLLGAMYSSKVAAEQMSAQGEGTIINVSSILGETSVPLLAAYAAAKHGVKGFSDALRLELAREHRGVNVTVILPSSINTPFFNNARSKLGVKPRPIPPAYEPITAARAIIFAAEHTRREIVVGGAGKLFIVLNRLSGSLMDTLMLLGDSMVKAQKSSQPDDGRDNLDQPSSGPGRVEGDFSKESMTISLYTELIEQHPGVRRALVAGAVVGLAALLLRQGRKLV